MSNNKPSIKNSVWVSNTTGKIVYDPKNQKKHHMYGVKGVVVKSSAKKKKFTEKEKGSYYSKRVNDKNLSKGQRAYAKRKVAVLFGPEKANSKSIIANGSKVKSKNDTRLLKKPKKLVDYSYVELKELLRSGKFKLQRLCSSKRRIY